MEWTVLGIRRAVAERSTTVRAVVEEALRRIEERDGPLHAFLTVCADEALAQADQLDARLAAGEEPGPLCGVPFGVKDLYETKGVRTTYGSRAFADNVPDRDAIVVARLRAAGAVLVGKTNTPEFAIYIRTVNDLQPESRNPWDPSRTTGGSSGGSAAAVAAGMVPFAVASDGGGSTRIPSALCGLVGILPSRGTVPRGGFIGTRRFSSSGPVTTTVDDAAAVLAVMAGPSDSDPVSRGLSPTGVLAEPWPQDRPARLRWVGDSGVPGAETDVVSHVSAGVRRFAAETGHSLTAEPVSLDSSRFSDDFYVMMQADRISTGGGDLLTDPGTREQLTGYARHHFQRGTQVSGAAYSRALETQLVATEHLLGLLEGHDALLTPTLAFVAPPVPEGPEALPEDARRGFVAFTFLMNYTGFPAVTVPCGTVRSLPVGLQLIGRPGSEPMLLDLARQFQDGTAPVGLPARSTLTEGVTP
ncbi:amidase [Ornithinimicrobium cavernae]|uniref:amidase n=1 Tax=Ornithinimicrobium cavernae TaxID=2666047 RepID=UPI00137B0547|nr:amidase [Ornithinimicrobium cavernae]